MKKLITITAIILSITSTVYSRDLNDGLILYMNFNNNIINQVTGEEAVIDSNANLQFPISEIDRGSYIKFDGTGGISFSNFQGLDEWTISFWFKVDKFPVGYYTYYSPVGKKADSFEGISGKYNFAVFQ